MNQGFCGRRVLRPLTAGVCLAGIIALLGANSVTAQQGKYVSQAATRLSKLIDQGNGANYKLTTNHFSIGGGWLNQSMTWTPLFSMTLEGGKAYRFLAAGDDDALDVDVRVMDMNGTQVAIDVARDATATVDYTPKKGGRHTVEVRVYDSRKGASGKKVPAYTMATVMAK